MSHRADTRSPPGGRPWARGAGQRGARRRIGAGFIVVWAVMAAPVTVTRAGEPPRPSFLESVEVRSANLLPFTKWASAMARYNLEKVADETRPCAESLFSRCDYSEWKEFLDTLRPLPAMEQLVVLNRHMNHYRYVTDPRNWGVEDYWESPGEFLARFGDCEDYAITKYLSLLRLGWTDDQLRIAAVKDTNLGVGHAVLIVWLDGRTWLLDNQIRQVIETTQVHHYVPVFSINQTAWWRHRPAG